MANPGEALTNARRLFASGQLAAAEGIYRHLLDAAPQEPRLWHELGILQLQAQCPQEALECLERAVALDGANAAYHANQGVAYRQLERHAEAAASFRRALTLGPRAPELLNNLALALKDCGRHDEALATFDEALAIRGDYANGHFNRANLLMDLGRLEEAIGGYQASIRSRPDDAGAHCKLGVAHYFLGQLDAALDSFNAALRFAPDYPEAHQNRALVWLARGEYDRGWPEYEWRLRCETWSDHPYMRPTWDGSPLAGRALLLLAEQGFGDILQFVRYVRFFEQTSQPVKLAIQPMLVPLLKCSGFERCLVPWGSEAEKPLRAPLMSLPRLLPALSGKPYWPGPYLDADPSRVALWRQRLSSISGFRVGIVWGGKRSHPYDRFRATTLDHFVAVARIPHVRLISLQREDAREQLDAVKNQFEVIELAEPIDPAGQAFMDTAAIMKNLELVISIDTSVAHLAGGLGVPVWVPLLVSPDWRWGTAGRQTPWYPTMGLFRQRQFGDWRAPFEEMAAELAKLVARSQTPAAH